MNIRRFVSTIFTAVATLAASAVSFVPVDSSSTFYLEASAGELVFVGDADSAKINLLPEKHEEISNIRLASGVDTINLTSSTLTIGTMKCYTVLYTQEDESIEKSYLCYVKKTGISPKVTVCPYDTIRNLVCSQKLKVKFSDLSYPNRYVTSKHDTSTIDNNIILSYTDYEANGLTIKDKLVEVIVKNAENDTTIFITKPRKHTVFKLKDKFSDYEFISDTFFTPLSFSTAQITVEAEAIPHNLEKRSEEALVFGSKEDAKANAANYMFSGPLEINIERNSVDNAPLDTILVEDPNNPKDSIKTTVLMDASYTWKFYNDSTGAMRNRYNVFYNDMSLTHVPIEEYGTHYVVLSSDNQVCKDTIYAAFKVRTSYLEMPTVFTPNGDGYNDEFRPTYTSISEYKIWIFNTMGIKMYESEDITVGWDGTHKGHNSPIGAYYYVVEATGVDGTEYKLKGTVNLVRN